MRSFGFASIRCPDAYGAGVTIADITVKMTAEQAHAGTVVFDWNTQEVTGDDLPQHGTVSVTVVNDQGGATQAFTLSAATQLQSGVATNAALAATATVLPESIPQPKIKSIEVKDGIVRLTVARTSKMVRYGVSSGTTPGALAADADFAPPSRQRRFGEPTTPTSAAMRRGIPSGWSCTLATRRWSAC